MIDTYVVKPIKRQYQLTYTYTETVSVTGESDWNDDAWEQAAVDEAAGPDNNDWDIDCERFYG